MGQEERDNHQEKETEQIKEMGALELGTDRKKHRIQLLTIIGEIEGHEAVSGNTKATKYEHLLPKLAEIEDSEEIEGVLILLNTMGGDVEAGLAIAEMIASLSKPTVSLVLGGRVIRIWNGHKTGSHAFWRNIPGSPKDVWKS